MESNTNTKSVDIVKNDETSYERVPYGFGTPKCHKFGLKSYGNIPDMLGNSWSTFVDLMVD